MLPVKGFNRLINNQDSYVQYFSEDEVNILVFFSTLSVPVLDPHNQDVQDEHGE